MSNEKKGLEFQFLESWEEWDEIDVGALFFYKVKPNAYLQEALKHDQHLIEQIDGAYLDISTNKFELYDSEGEALASFKIKAELINV